MSRVYGIWLTPAGRKDPIPEYWEGEAVNVIDALTMARNAYGPNQVWRCRVEIKGEAPSNASLELIE